jgi:uncharacterized SAM-binding protein YcdF (DUF218 family)
MMFFVASKILWILADPINLMLFGAGAGLIFRRRRLAGLCLALLLIAGFSPIGALLLRGLEDRFPLPGPNASAPYGIVVLGGAIDDVIGEARGEIVLRDGGSRLTEAALLARRFPEARLVYTGGSGSLTDLDGHEAEEAKRLLIGLGVAPARIALETKTRNTDENARFTAAMLGPDAAKSWWVVTSAYHMPRAMGLFRKAGFDATAYPVDYYTTDGERDLQPLGKAADGLRLSEIALHEWTGLAAYWATGRIASPFPGP